MRPDLAKFRHFGKMSRLWPFFEGLFSIWHILHILWQIFIFVNGQIFEKQSSYLVTLLVVQKENRLTMNYFFIKTKNG